ncbi:hypothetical protein [Streptomyces yangpuensis]|uniref:hypothetical protein n=1 Tax=Streptomyces yangpuensis TaxID=1648182 RepID=UPI0037219BE2
MDPDDKHRRPRTLGFPAPLAADLPGRQARPGERRPTVQTGVEEAESARRTAEGLTDRTVRLTLTLGERGA